MAPERKTATSLLLKKSDEHPEGWRLQTFGDRAEREYLDARTNHQGKDLALFKHFKMELFQGGRDRKGGREVDDVMGIATDNVVKLPLVYIVSLALGDIMKQIVKRLNNSDQVTLRSTDIRWVLTVPAVWSNFGKRFMRAAAYKGGLIKFEDDQEVRNSANSNLALNLLLSGFLLYSGILSHVKASHESRTKTGTWAKAPGSHIWDDQMHTTNATRKAFCRANPSCTPAPSSSRTYVD